GCLLRRTPFLRSDRTKKIAGTLRQSSASRLLRKNKIGYHTRLDIKHSNLFYPCLILADEAAGKGKKESVLTLRINERLRLDLRVSLISTPYQEKAEEVLYSSLR